MSREGFAATIFRLSNCTRRGFGQYDHVVLVDGPSSRETLC
jgi:hypothetical protein